MYVAEILGSKSKQQSNKTFNEVALIFSTSIKAIYVEKSFLSVDGYGES